MRGSPERRFALAAFSNSMPGGRRENQRRLLVDEYTGGRERAAFGHGWTEFMKSTMSLCSSATKTEMDMDGDMFADDEWILPERWIIAYHHCRQPSFL